MTDLGRGHFSFNTKVNVGDFYEARVTGGENVSYRTKSRTVPVRMLFCPACTLERVQTMYNVHELQLLLVQTTMVLSKSC